MTDGTLVTTQQRAVIRFERHLPHPPETVFSALVDPAELAAWFPCTIDGDWREGSPLRFVVEQWPDEDARSGGNGKVA